MKNRDKSNKEKLYYSITILVPYSSLEHEYKIFRKFNKGNFSSISPSRHFFYFFALLLWALFTITFIFLVLLLLTWKLLVTLKVVTFNDLLRFRLTKKIPLQLCYFWLLANQVFIEFLQPWKFKKKN